jgi:outer membrane protein assembly factor BamB
MDRRRSRANSLGTLPGTFLGGLILVLLGCGSASPGGTGSQVPPLEPAPTASAMATAGSIPSHRESVATYRGDAARTGAMPGPAPSGQPSIAWTFQAGAPISSSPLVVDDIVYVLANDGVVHALALETGAERWSVQLGADASASPLITDGLLIVGDSAGTVHALAIADGSTRWTLSTDGPITGAAAAADGRVAVIATMAGTAYAFDVASGTIEWQTTLRGAVSTSVAIEDGIVYVGASPNLIAMGIADGKIRWSEAVSKEGRIGTPTAAGGIVYAATGLDAEHPAMHGVVALDAATGLQRWRYTSPTEDAVYTPAIVDGRAYIAGEDRRVTALDAASGDLVWATTTEQVNEAVAAFSDGFVFVAGNGGAMNVLEARTGEIAWSVPYRGTPYGPVVVGGYVLVGTNLGALIAIGGSTN